jgi:cytochrome c
MSTLKTFATTGSLAGVACILAGCMHTAPAQRLDLGKAASLEEIRGWDIDARADGAGLPPGAGSVAQGRKIYEAQCASCHGANGQKGIAPALAGGQGTLTGKAPVKTVGSFWPYAPTLYDYINRAMPFDKPQSLTADQVYAVTAYTLHMNGIVGPETVLDARTLPKVAMPNRGGFVPDPRPDAGR